ncbi:MAG: site-2 protease family protein [Pirellulales bacterium]
MKIPALPDDPPLIEPPRSDADTPQSVPVVPPRPMPADSQPGQHLDLVEGRELRASDIDPRIDSQRQPERRRNLSIVLFVATCLSTFWVGAADWRPVDYMSTVGEMMRVITANWQQGLTYMGAVLAILLTHEMGHFIQTLRHHIPASYPLCIPVPFNAIGTMGAVIGMDGLRANRKQIFDIGIAGPLAGLVVAVPILWIGVQRLDLARPPEPNEIQLYNPLIVQWMLSYLHPQWAEQSWVGISQVNPFFMAGWVGMLITGLNMLPISQLDGGHTIYGLFGKDAHKIARAFVIIAILYVVLNLEQAAIWTPMLILVILMGIDHPPTSDDSVELDNWRWMIGVWSLGIPIICFPLLGLRQ